MKYEALSELVKTTCEQLHKRLETMKQFQQGKLYHIDYQSYSWSTHTTNQEHTTGIYRGASFNNCGGVMSAKMDILTSTEKPYSPHGHEGVPVNSVRSFKIPEGMILGAPRICTSECRGITAFREIQQDDLLIYVGDAYTSERFRKYLSGTNRVCKTVVPETTPEPSSKLEDVLKCLQQVTT